MNKASSKRTAADVDSSDHYEETDREEPPVGKRPRKLEQLNVKAAAIIMKNKLEKIKGSSLKFEARELIRLEHDEKLTDLLRCVKKTYEKGSLEVLREDPFADLLEKVGPYDEASASVTATKTESSNRDEKSDDGFSSFKDLVDYVLGFFKEKDVWKEFTFRPVISDGAPRTFDEWQGVTFEEAKGKVAVDNGISLTIWHTDAVRPEMKRSNVRQKLASEFPYLVKLESESLSGVLKKSTLEVLVPRDEKIINGLKIRETVLDKVRTTPNKTTWKQAFQSSIDRGRKKTLVVAGESGSGKSVFACLAPKSQGSEVLYAKMNISDTQSHNEHVMGEQEKVWLTALGTILGDSTSFGILEDSRTFLLLSALSSTFHFERNESAIGKAREALKKSLLKPFDFADDEENRALRDKVESWWEGKLPRPLLKKLTLVVDEGLNLDFARAIVDGGGSLCALLEERNLAEKVFLVLAGTGLDRVMDPNNPGSTVRFGTNPNKALVVTVDGPNVASALDGVEKAVKQGLEEGSHSRILMSNTRMLFRAVLPLLEMDVHVKAPDGFYKSEEARLQSLGSYLDLMDYAIRFYLETNSIKSLNSETQFSYLDDCFRHHLKQSIQGSTTHEPLPNFQVDMLQVDENIFEYGLARKGNDTSNALKHLSCFGLCGEIEAGSGPSLAKLTAFHLVRYMKAVEGFDAHFAGKLKFEWPPPAQNYTDVQGSIASFMSEHDSDAFFGELERELERKGLSKSACFVFLNGGQRAQGPDVFVLKRQENSPAKLDLYQCKNYKSFTSIEWGMTWASLGIAFKEPTGKKGSEYCGLGITRLCDRLARIKSLKKVSVGRRCVVVTSEATSCRSYDHYCPEGKDCHIIFREALAPTISIYPGSDKLVGTADNNMEAGGAH